MQGSQLIKADEFCESHHIDLSFIQTLSQYGLLQLKMTEEQLLISDDQLSMLEKIVRLHFDLEINVEGIEAIMHLTDRIEALQKEMLKLKNRLEFYEEERV